MIWRDTQAQLLVARDAELEGRAVEATKLFDEVAPDFAYVRCSVRDRRRSGRFLRKLTAEQRRWYVSGEPRWFDRWGADSGWRREYLRAWQPIDSAGPFGPRFPVSAHRLLSQMLARPHQRGLMLVSTYTHAKSGAWRDLKRLCEQISTDAEFNETRMRCRLPNGSVILVANAAAGMDRLRGHAFDYAMVNAPIERDSIEVLMRHTESP